MTVKRNVPRKQKTPTFEKALKELETLVESLEQGDQSLEESLQSFERGVTLTRVCQEALQEAEQKVRILNGDARTSALEPFSDDNE
ncbi:MAG: exodeoxyribonuclease VII small subunit [Candidatus Thiodiazotropha sp. (ex Epidulcina cf. delphinae)]|nr:exodeoxyribonuclease VII small subunit [Candidatus Thiodiazotropha sp. (ex Epidulcina cf. delphinae)]